MRRQVLMGSLFLSVWGGYALGQVGLVIVDPGHYHATLIQKDMYPQMSPRVSVYAPLGPDLLDYMNRISLFNSRPQDPTHWELDVHTGPGFFERMLRDHPGNVVVFAGRNREKIDRILRSVGAGYNVLADKPWIIASANMGKLAEALDQAERKNLIAYDIMTERYEITSILQKELVNTPEVFGQQAPGSESKPGITARSIHYLMKSVAGVPFRRPAWFFNIYEAGEAAADVGTHLVDLVEWTAFPRQQVDYRTDIKMLQARRWPNLIGKAQFAEVTGESDFPSDLKPWLKDGQFDYYSNNAFSYTVRGVHVALDIRWSWEAPAGSGDLYEATFRGAKSRVEVRQRPEQHYQPELYVVPANASLREEVFAALRKKIDALENDWPGVQVAVEGGEAHIVIPEKYRVGHEAHFAQVTRAFLGYLKDPKSIPAWEKSNMLVKYYVTTEAVELSRRNESAATAARQ